MRGIIILCLMLCVAFFPAVQTYTLECYTCNYRDAGRNSTGNVYCMKEPENDPDTEDIVHSCVLPASKCFTHIREDPSASTYYERGCMVRCEDYDNVIGDVTDTRSCCNGDLCNEATSLAYSTAILLVPLLTATATYLF